MSQNISSTCPGFKPRHICPFMSKPATGNPETIGGFVCQAMQSLFWGRYDIVLCEIDCRQDRCQAWIEPCDIFKENVKNPSETMQECPAFEFDCEASRPCCAGYCALIHPKRWS